MLFRWRLGALALATLALCALAATTQPSKTGVVETFQGQTFPGEITQDDKYVTITAHGVAMRLDKRNVAKITYTASVDDQFSGRFAKLAADDVQGRIDLAKWASDQQRPDLAVVALQDAHKIDPTNQVATDALGNAQQEIDLEARRAASPAAPGGAAPKPAGPVVAKPTVEHRLLTDDEVNRIRQKEMSADDPGVHVRFDNGVVARFLATGAYDPAAFRQLAVPQQASQIISAGDPSMANDVRVVSDPQSLLTFKEKVSPLIASSCASTACHGGASGGDFGLFSGASVSVVYTNYYILQTYTKAIGGTQYRTIDRSTPDRSLVLEFSLPAGMADVNHPQVAGYRPRFRSRDDVGYRQILTWINGLSPIAPSYGIAVSPVLPPPPAN